MIILLLILLLLQVGQVILTMPTSYAQMGFTWAVIFQIFYFTTGIYTCYLLTRLYIEYRVRKEKEGVDFKKHVIQVQLPRCLLIHSSQSHHHHHHHEPLSKALVARVIVLLDLQFLARICIKKSDKLETRLMLWLRVLLIRLVIQFFTICESRDQAAAPPPGPQ